MSLGDRLKRFSALSVAETQPVIFCTEKQELDKKILAGLDHKVAKAVPLKGQDLYYDPNTAELEIIKHYRQLDLAKEKKKADAKKFQALLKTIPKVDYFPTTRLAEMYRTSELKRQENPGFDESRSLQEAELSSADINLREGVQSGDNFLEYVGNDTAETSLNGNQKVSKNTIGSRQLAPIDSLSEDWRNVERDYKEAYQAAKRGDTQALFNHAMRPQQKLSPIAKRPSSQMESPSSSTVREKDRSTNKELGRGSTASRGAEEVGMQSGIRKHKAPGMIDCRDEDQQDPGDYNGDPYGYYGTEEHQYNAGGGFKHEEDMEEV
jgi:hypothetical protein